MGCGPTAAELARIRSDVAAIVLDLSCVIQRKAITKDGMGQATESWNTIAITNAGIKQPSGAHLANYDYLIGALSTWQVNLPYGTDVHVQDHLIIGSDTLVVQIALLPQSYDALTTVLASEVK